MKLSTAAKEREGLSARGVEGVTSAPHWLAEAVAGVAFTLLMAVIFVGLLIVAPALMVAQ